MVKVVAIPPGLVDVVWPQVGPLLRKAMGEDERSEVLEEIKSGVSLLFVMVDGQQIIAAATAKLINNGQLCDVPYIAGTRMSEWFEELDNTISRIAKEAGATEIQGRGRVGWIKAAKPYGYRVKRVTVSKRI